VWLDDDRLRPLFEACAQRGILVQAHLAQPSRWWPDRYEPGRCGPKAIYLEQMERVLERTPGLPYLGAHFGGCPEEPGYVADLMAAHPGYHVDTSATKWVVRELSARRDEAREVFLRFPDRICFGSDLVVQEGVDFDYYTSRFHVQRTMWETGGRGLSMIADPDAPAGGPHLCGLDLPQTVLGKLYRENAARLLGLTAG
jgi:predicted TIM-barrel fold metal-dependent hydrolase